MSELAPDGGAKLLPADATEGDAYVQKTSLAADKPVFPAICIQYFTTC